MDWSNVPHHVLSLIFSYLKQRDKFNVSMVNKCWNYVVFNSPILWKSFHFKFLNDNKLHNLKGLDHIKRHTNYVLIDVNPGNTTCREASLKILEGLATADKRLLEKIKIRFIGENPLLYSGVEFIEALFKLFTIPSTDGITHKTLIEVDLSEFRINLHSRVLTILADNHFETLQKVSIQNDVLVNAIDPLDILYLISKCHNLTHLGLHGSAVDDSVILALTQPPHRTKLKKLVIFCRRDQKYIDTISSNAWSTLVKHSPDLDVTLGFDHTCPLELVSQVMKPEIPVSELFLETCTDLQAELKLAIENYHRTLRKLSVSTPPQWDDSFEKELIRAAKECNLLRSLHVFCVISENTISEILSLKPILKERNSYTMECEAKPGPWIPGNDYYDNQQFFN